MSKTRCAGLRSFMMFSSVVLNSELEISASPAKSIPRVYARTSMEQQSRRCHRQSGSVGEVSPEGHHTNSSECGQHDPEIRVMFGQKSLGRRPNPRRGRGGT